LFPLTCQKSDVLSFLRWLTNRLLLALIPL
jgi:hypothetical protein